MSSGVLGMSCLILKWMPKNPCSPVAPLFPLTTKGARVTGPSQGEVPPQVLS